ncbi:hypothetical protein NDU88_006208 [Pleurodeles waltl]|uniref:Uncharacterized protein n=1 Tax=Pleurodeles waltl TaxID=8319 RepID=A0AAV7MBJ6_PLEWA|nr:hypothetical protein NDU88_006208 [Pleurodeles waltl]
MQGDSVLHGGAVPAVECVDLLGGSRREGEDATPGQPWQNAAAAGDRTQPDARRDPRQPRQDASGSGCSNGRQLVAGRRKGAGGGASEVLINWEAG